MKSSVKKRWLDALRSGKYKQGKGNLMDANPVGDGPARFCCLGVLCDLHSRSTRKAKWNYDKFIPLYLRNDSFLPPEVVKWAGLDGNVNDENDVVLRKANGEALKDTLSEANDGGKRFTGIATLIEKYL